eukprot:CAMPEP_0115849154 /NCGR_PEP_ID=MMETSP0287-20121206/11302_1 /TAXON_ID=412157 /ORGANISM="Chrysochromulina rotalis, Strain UIO044" /LENGTH=236 /DNA_ID=CAMNT_0003303111 /DNA_START=40 /DNA_END=750 /DNA_ORIENTATION=+
MKFAAASLFHFTISASAAFAPLSSSAAYPCTQPRASIVLRGNEYDAAARAAARAARAAGHSPNTVHDGRVVPQSMPQHVPQGMLQRPMRAADAIRQGAARTATLGQNMPTPVATQPPAPQAAAPHSVASAPATATSPNGLDGDSVVAALSEFVNTPYARQQCQYCGAGPTDYGQVWGMFETVRLVENNKLKVKLHRSFEQRADKLLDMLAKHLRKSLPQLERLQYDQATTTKTIVL